MKRSISKILAVGAMFCIAVSCNFLDLKPEHSFVDMDMLVSYSDAQAAVNGIYSNIWSDSYAGELFAKQSSKAGILHTYYLSNFEENFNVTTTTEFAGAWPIYYAGVNYANFAVNGITGMAESAFESEDMRNALIGEARLYRAWIYIHIFKNFCHWWEKDDSPYGLIWRDQVSNLSNLQVERLTVGESYEKILEDLDYAIQNCPALSTLGNKKMTKEYAKVLKAKLLLDRGASDVRGISATDFQEAKSLVDELYTVYCEGSNANWIIEEDMEAMYKNSFDSKENLFVRYRPDWNSSSYATSTAGFFYGYGIAYASTNANNAITDAESNPIPYDPDNFDGGLAPKNLETFKEDPRWAATTGIMYNGETWDNTLKFVIKKLYRGGYYKGAVSNPLYKCDYKFNVYYFRLYELYLLKAELILRTGGTPTDALAVLNKVRSKRTNPVLPVLSASTAANVYELIYKEYLSELYLENGADYFASLRITSPDGDKYIQYNKKGQGVTFSWDRQCYQIPSSETGNNKLATPVNPY